MRLRIWIVAATAAVLSFSVDFAYGAPDAGDASADGGDAAKPGDSGDASSAVDAADDAATPADAADDAAAAADAGDDASGAAADAAEAGDGAALLGIQPTTTPDNLGCAVGSPVSSPSPIFAFPLVCAALLFAMRARRRTACRQK